MVGHSVDELVERQKQNEDEILNKGIEKYREALMNAKDSGHMADTMPGRWLTANFIEPVAVKIRAFVHEGVSGKHGTCPAGAKVLNWLRPDAAAYIALRTIMNSLLGANGQCEKSRVQNRIKDELVDELQFNYMRRENTPAYIYWTREMNRAPDPATKRRIELRLKRNFPDLPGFQSEGEILQLRAAAELLIRFTVEATGMAAIERKTKRHVGDRPHCLVLNPEFEARIEKMHARAEIMWPKFEPMLCPPRPWTGAYKGGFVGKQGERTVLVRTGNRAYLKEVHHNIRAMDKALRALNAVQATPWRINARVYAVMRAVFDSGDGGRGLPAGKALPTPPRPADIKADREAAKEYVARLKAAQRLEARRVSQRRAAGLMLDTAHKYLDEKAVYFAHNLDWRGRVYPLSSYLSPQGEETHRALLEFAAGLPLADDEAAEWLAIHGAGCFGVDKVSFAERVQWVREHEREIRLSAQTPLECDFWTRAEKPWMFLAWCFDWLGFLEKGGEHVSHLPVAMDGSCNGLQNFAAMLRHAGTARAVNLAPSATPNDIYRQIAERVVPKVAAMAVRDSRGDAELLAVCERRTADEFADKDKTRISRTERLRTADLWSVLAARWMAGHIDRKLVKRPVMTYPYSVTLYGIRDQLVATLLEMNAQNPFYPDKHVGKVADMLKVVVHEAIRETVVAAAEAMRWLREAARVVAEANLPLTWTSPVGMPVMQNYWKSTTKKVMIRSRRQNVQYQFRAYLERVGEVKPSKQAAGVAPNFVHSCDASHLMFTVNACLDAGVADFHMIHDSYGTHACNAALLARTLRERFVAMYGDRDVLADFHRQLQARAAHLPGLAERIPPPPAPGDFDLAEVTASKYFFA